MCSQMDAPTCRECHRRVHRRRVIKTINEQGMLVSQLGGFNCPYRQWLEDFPHLKSTDSFPLWQNARELGIDMDMTPSRYPKRKEIRCVECGQFRHKRSHPCAF